MRSSKIWENICHLMKGILDILRPVAWVVLAVGVAKFALTLLGAPRWVVYLASLTFMELAGGLYLAIRAGRNRQVGYLHLWAGVLLLFGEAQLLYIAGLVYTWLSGQPSLYHETERLVAFLGREPSIPEHIGMHVTNWMIIAPTIFTWVIGAPIVYFTRRFASNRDPV